MRQQQSSPTSILKYLNVALNSWCSIFAKTGPQDRGNQLGGEEEGRR